MSLNTIFSYNSLINNYVIKLNYKKGMKINVRISLGFTNDWKF